MTNTSKSADNIISPGSDTGYAVDEFLADGFEELKADPAETKNRADLLEARPEHRDADFESAVNTSLGPDEVKQALSVISRGTPPGQSVYVPVGDDMMRIAAKPGGGYEGTIYHESGFASSPAKTSFEVDQNGNVTSAQTVRFTVDPSGAGTWKATGVIAGKALDNAAVSRLIQERSGAEYTQSMDQRRVDVNTFLGVDRNRSFTFPDGVELSVTRFEVPEIRTAGKVIPAHEQYLVRRIENGEWTQVSVDGRDGRVHSLMGSTKLPGTHDLTSYPIDLDERLAVMTGRIPPQSANPTPQYPLIKTELSSKQSAELLNFCKNCIDLHGGMVINQAGGVSVGLLQGPWSYLVRMTTEGYTGPGDRNYDGVEFWINHNGQLIDEPRNLRFVNDTPTPSPVPYNPADMPELMRRFQAITGAQTAPPPGSGPGGAGRLLVSAPTLEGRLLQACLRCSAPGTPEWEYQRGKGICVTGPDPQGNYQVQYRERWDGPTKPDRTYSWASFRVSGTTGEVLGGIGVGRVEGNRASRTMRERAVEALSQRALTELERYHRP